MAYWQVKVKVQTEGDNGKVRNHQELFLANAESATEAETLAHKEFEGETFYDFEVVDCKKTKVIKILS